MRIRAEPGALQTEQSEENPIQALDKICKDSDVYLINKLMAGDWSMDDLCSDALDIDDFSDDAMQLEPAFEQSAVPLEHGYHDSDGVQEVPAWNMPSTWQPVFEDMPQYVPAMTYAMPPLDKRLTDSDDLKHELQPKTEKKRHRIRKKMSELSPSKRAELREKNRISARNLRAHNKAKREFNELYSEGLEEKNMALRQEKETLEKEIKLLEHIIRDKYSFRPTC